MKRAILWIGVASVAACGPRIDPLVRQGDYIGSQADVVVQRARGEAAAEQAHAAEALAHHTTEALTSCAPAICEAISRGELALGMTEAQVLTATRTTEEAWQGRGQGRVRVLAAQTGVARPADAVGDVAWVQLQNGRVTSYTYREAQGLRTVSSPADATLAGRSAAMAETLLAEGDRFTVLGDLDAALDRYDRADVLRPNHPQTTLRIARTLDKQLRPLEARMRYMQFVHQLELERIAAHGDAAAKMAEAIAHARERIVVLEKHR